MNLTNKHVSYFLQRKMRKNKKGWMNKIKFPFGQDVSIDEIINLNGHVKSSYCDMHNTLGIIRMRRKSMSDIDNLRMLETSFEKKRRLLAAKWLNKVLTMKSNREMQ